MERGKAKTIQNEDLNSLNNWSQNMENKNPGTNSFKKITITEEAEKALTRMHVLTNQDNTGGKVSKVELLSWVIFSFEKNPLSSTQLEIRSTHFDQIAYLKSVCDKLMTAKREGATRPDLAQLLAPLTSVAVRWRQKTRVPFT